ncbi:MAG TPA: DUF58 domain-containing protein [Chloroflexota bacterium]|nr:DUF58 domain-containing protein [Chloroflexota bacterium]
MNALIVLLLLVAAAISSAPLFFVAAVLCILRVAVYLWLRTAAGALRATRSCEHRVFYGDRITVRIHVENAGPLPIPWLRLVEHRPGALILPSVLTEVVALGAGRRRELSYTMVGRQRGLHAVGPLFLTAGDAFGLSQQQLLLPQRQYLIVYPRLLAARDLGLPSFALFGDLRTQRRMLGDPARIAGVRDYRPGDPLHDIHWRATAAAGQLQVKQYQPSTSVQTLLVLDQHPAGYHTLDALAAGELAISVAATIAERLIDQRQEVGLVTNGRLALLPPDEDVPAELLRSQQELVASVLVTPSGAAEAAFAPATVPIPAGRGRGQLMRLFEVLARLQLNDQGDPLRDLLLHPGLAPSWGSTMVVITGAAGSALLASLHRLREAGVLVELLVIDRRTAYGDLRAQAQALGVRFHVLWPDHDLPALSA